MEDKRTEAEKCNGWLKKVSAFIYCVFYCGGEGYYDDYVYEDCKRRVKEDYAPLVSKCLKSLESSDKEQRKKAILSIINYFDVLYFKDSDYPTNYKFAIDQCRKGYFKSPNNINIEDPRLFWFRKLVKEEISGVEICRMLLTCQELEEYEIGISLGHEYVKDENNYYRSELDKSLVNKHIEVLQEKIRLREEEISRKEQEDLDKELSGMDYRDYQDELKEESWFAMTEGMYGDYEGDIDMDKLGY